MSPSNVTSNTVSKSNWRWPGCPNWKTGKSFLPVEKNTQFACPKNTASFDEKMLSLGYLGLKSCYDSAHICPIRVEISTHDYWENVFILLFVWLVVMGFRQNYFHISPNFGDFGAKTSFFRYIINQKRKIFIKHCPPPPPPCSKTPLISEMCIYITNNLCKWGLGTRGGGGGGNNVLQTKWGGPASSTWNTIIANGKLHQW